MMTIEELTKKIAMLPSDDLLPEDTLMEYDLIDYNRVRVGHIYQLMVEAVEEEKKRIITTATEKLLLKNIPETVGYSVAIQYIYELNQAIAGTKSQKNPEFYETIIKSQQWQEWGKVAHEEGFDWHESTETGWLSDKHFQAFLNFCNKPREGSVIDILLIWSKDFPKDTLYQIAVSNTEFIITRGLKTTSDGQS